MKRDAARRSSLLAWLGFTLILSASAFSLPDPRPSQQQRSTRLHVCSVELTDPETGCQVVLLGCFHGSLSSAEDVEAALSSSKKTDVVVLELCASRFEDMRKDLTAQDEKEAKEGEASEKKPWIQRYGHMVQRTAQSQGLPTAVAAAVLGGVSGLQTAISNLQPGLEFSTATRIAARENMDIVLADAPVEKTLKEMGQLPQISFSMWAEFFSNGASWDETFGREAAALKTALTSLGACTGDSSLHFAQHPLLSQA